MAKELSFLGVPVTADGKGGFKVSKSDQAKVLNDLGVTKDVRKVITEAENTIAEAAVEFTGAQVLKSKENVQLILGSGDSKVTYAMKAKSTNRNPADGSSITSYGAFSIRKRGIVPKALKEGIITDWSKKIEASMR